MTKPSVIILSGPVQSGKTSALLKWCEDRNDVDGIISPDINGVRYFLHIKTKELFLMEAGEEEENILLIGKYTFSKTAFEKADQILRNAMLSKINYIVVDEVGPLELKGEGFSATIKQFLSAAIPLNIILVVRAHLLDPALEYFGIDAYTDFAQL